VQCGRLRTCQSVVGKQREGREPEKHHSMHARAHPLRARTVLPLRAREEI
jgi:hypothetical protein